MGIPCCDTGDVAGTKLTSDKAPGETQPQRPLCSASSVTSLAEAGPKKKDSYLAVHIVCKHFKQEHLTNAASLSHETKYCQACDKDSDLLYAFWNTKKQWQILRPYPRGVQADFQECKHYKPNQPCGRVPCTFAHGPKELKLWTAQRKRGLYETRDLHSSIGHQQRVCIHIVTNLRFLMYPFS